MDQLSHRSEPEKWQYWLEPDYPKHDHGWDGHNSDPDHCTTCCNIGLDYLEKKISALRKDLEAEREARKEAEANTALVLAELKNVNENAKGLAADNERAEAALALHQQTLDAEAGLLKQKIAELEARLKKLAKGGCDCWQDPTPGSEQGHHKHCPEQATKLMAGYCARIRELVGKNQYYEKGQTWELWQAQKKELEAALEECRRCLKIKTLAIQDACQYLYSSEPLAKKMRESLYDALAAQPKEAK